MIESTDICTGTLATTTLHSDHDLTFYVSLSLFTWLCFLAVALCFLFKWKIGLGQTARDLQLLENYTSSIHYGLVELGGFRRFGQMTAEQHRYMFTTEQANFECHSRMGPERYMQLLCGGPDTPDGEESHQEAEEEDAEQDQSVPADPASRSHVLARLQTLLRECLSQNEFSDAAAVQQTILSGLAWGVPRTELDTMQLREMVMHVVVSLNRRVRRAETHSLSRMAPTIRAYVHELESLVSTR